MPDGETANAHMSLGRPGKYTDARIRVRHLASVLTYKSDEEQTGDSGQRT
jgi:hypothetical protein